MFVVLKVTVVCQGMVSESGNYSVNVAVKLNEVTEFFSSADMSITHAAVIQDFTCSFIL